MAWETKSQSLFKSPPQLEKNPLKRHSSRKENFGAKNWNESSCSTPFVKKEPPTWSNGHACVRGSSYSANVQKKENGWTVWLDCDTFSENVPSFQDEQKIEYTRVFSSDTWPIALSTKPTSTSAFKLFTFKKLLSKWIPNKNLYIASNLRDSMKQNDHEYLQCKKFLTLRSDWYCVH